MNEKKYTSYPARALEYEEMVKRLKIERMINIIISDYNKKQENTKKKVLIKEDKRC